MRAPHVTPLGLPPDPQQVRRPPLPAAGLACVGVDALKGGHGGLSSQGKEGIGLGGGSGVDSYTPPSSEATVMTRPSLTSGSCPSSFLQDVGCCVGGGARPSVPVLPCIPTYRRDDLRHPGSGLEAGRFAPRRLRSCLWVASTPAGALRVAQGPLASHLHRPREEGKAGVWHKAGHVLPGISHRMYTQEYYAGCNDPFADT